MEGRLSRLGPKDRLKMMRQLVVAVAAMNARGISHNDLKMDNIITLKDFIRCLKLFGGVNTFVQHPM